MKKILHKYKETFLIGILSILLVGCSSDFLDTPDYGSLDKDGFIETEDAAYRMLTKCYNHFNDHWNYGVMWFELGDSNTDDSSKGGSDASDRGAVTDIVRGNPLTTNGNLAGWWQHRYKNSISSCNTFLSLVTEETELIAAGGALVDLKTKQRWISEVHFLRALCYFELAMYFGDIPIIDQPLNVIDQGSIVKSDRDTVIKFILDELGKAIDSNTLPKASSLPEEEIGRITHEGALAYRARVLLWQSNYNEAKKDLKQVVESGAYDLIEDYAYLFNDKEKGHKSKEAVFVQLRDVNTPYLSGIVNPLMNSGRFNGGGWGGQCPTDELVKQFEKGDPRLTYTVLSHNDKMTKADGKEELHVYNQPTYDNPTLQHSRKQYAVASLRYGAGANLQETYWTFYQIRYADVLLMYAECLIETNDDKNLAVELINKVRKRAFVTTSPKDPYATFRKFDVAESDKVDEATFESKYKVKVSDDLRAAVRHERRVELGLEGLRFYDLMRWGIYVPTMQAFGKGEGRRTQAGINVTEKTWPYPIPQTEIDIVGGSLVQHDNY